ncbi:hypothetical protein HK102_010652, partial [Quaeritorhiza haematococci]
MQGLQNEPGIIPLAIHDIFKFIIQNPQREFLLRVSYLEIYNEAIKDLLQPNRENLKIHENPNKEIFIGDLSEHVVVSPAEVEQLLSKGQGHRHIGETNMNERSSRSHTIFRMVIESRERTHNDSGQRISSSGAVKVSCLNLVDLAGSERVGHTGAEGIRLKEGGHINKSLLALGSVIAKLAEGGDKRHIPYRDSKLTRILQPSLGGNAKTAIICTITPAITYSDETLSTLKFANRAKNIRNRPEVNEVLSDEALLRKYRSEINTLRMQLDQIKQNTGDLSSDQQKIAADITIKQRLQEQEQQKSQLMSQIERLKKMIINSPDLPTHITKVCLNLYPNASFFTTDIQQLQSFTSETKNIPSSNLVSRGVGADVCKSALSTFQTNIELDLIHLSLKLLDDDLSADGPSLDKSRSSVASNDDSTDIAAIPLNDATPCTPQAGFTQKYHNPTNEQLTFAMLMTAKKLAEDRDFLMVEYEVSKLTEMSKKSKHAVNQDLPFLSIYKFLRIFLKNQQLDESALSVQETVVSAEEKMRLLEMSLSELTNVFNEQRSQYETVVKESQSARDEIQALKDDNEKLSHETSTMRQKLSEITEMLRSERETNTSEKEVWMAEMEQLQKMLADEKEMAKALLEQQKTAIQQDAEKALVSQTLRLQHENALLEERLSAMCQDFEGKERELATQVAELQQQRVSLEEQLSVVQQNKEGTEKSFESRVDKMQQDMKLLEEQLFAVRKDAEDREKDLVSRTVQLEEEKASLMEQLTTTCKDAEDKENILALQATQLLQEKAQFENELSTLWHEMEENEKTFTARIAQLQQEVTSMEEQLSIKEKDIDDKRRAFESQSAQLQEKAGLEAQKKAQFENELYTMRHEMEDNEKTFTARIVQLQEEVSSLEEQLSTKEKDNEDTRRAFETQSAQLQEEKAGLEAQIKAQFENELSTMRHEIEDNEKTFTARIVHLQQEVSSLEEQLSTKEKDIEDTRRAFETQCAQLQEEKAGLEAQISDLQQDFQEKENNLTS